jgi:pimeloyl-ACP methyl ester carboxylesterase
VRDILPDIRCPTLVAHRTGDRLIRVAAGKDLADRIPNAEFVELPGDDHWWFIGDAAGVLETMQPYLDISN